MLLPLVVGSPGVAGATDELKVGSDRRLASCCRLEVAVGVNGGIKPTVEQISLVINLLSAFCSNAPI